MAWNLPVTPETVLDSLGNGLYITDNERHILSWNHAAEKLYGRTWQQMKGYPLADLYQDSGTYEQFVVDVQSGNSLREKELAVKHPDGNTRFVSTSTTVLYDGHHNVEGFIFLSRDVTASKDLEKKYNTRSYSFLTEKLYLHEWIMKNMKVP